MCYSTYGDTMKTNIVYTDNKLYVNTSGNIDKDNYNSLKEKVNYIINEYNINDVIFDFKDSNIENEFLNDVNNNFNNVKIIK